MEHIDASVRAGPRGVPMALSAVLAKPGVGGVAVSVEDVENILSMWPEAYIVTEPSKQAPLAKSSASAAAALPSAKAPSMSGFVIALPMAAMTSRLLADDPAAAAVPATVSLGPAVLVAAMTSTVHAPRACENGVASSSTAHTATS
jgi:hypothetical protein